MGFNNLAIICGIISGGYQANFELTQRLAEKLGLGNQARMLAQERLKLMQNNLNFQNLPPDIAQALAEIDSSLLGIKSKEVAIDQELELIRSTGLAAVTQQQEFVKYLGESIKTGFKNAYA